MRDKGVALYVSGLVPSTGHLKLGGQRRSLALPKSSSRRSGLDPAHVPSACRSYGMKSSERSEPIAAANSDPTKSTHSYGNPAPLRRRRPPIWERYWAACRQCATATSRYDYRVTGPDLRERLQTPSTKSWPLTSR